MILGKKLWNKTDVFLGSVSSRLFFSLLQIAAAWLLQFCKNELDFMRRYHESAATQNMQPFVRILDV